MGELWKENVQRKEIRDTRGFRGLDSQLSNVTYYGNYKATSN